MLRLRLPGGIVSSHQAKGLCSLAERFGGGYLHVTTRANLQIREIGAAHSIAVLTAVDELGLTSRGAGADNIRNLTGSPAAGIDPKELIDTRPLTRELYHHILNHRELYGLPRKFNIAFDGGGRLGVLEDTNDIGLAAVAVGTGRPVPAGVYFRMLLGGITGHAVFARDSGVLLPPHEVVPAAVAIVRLFIDHGDRTDRKRARLHYLIERWGIEKCLAEAARHLSFPWQFAPLDICEPRGPIEKHGHIGVHPQSQPGLHYIGVVLPVGRLEAAQLRGLADVAERCGSGTLRLTVWQNLLVSDIPEARLAEALAAIKGLGLDASASAIRGGVVACTGNFGCKFALSDTKRHALALIDHLDTSLALDRPINIHLTGCPNSCAQHYVGDIGLLATKVEKSEDEEVEGYHIVVGGGSGAEFELGREVCRSVPAEEMPRRVEAMLQTYLAQRRPGEDFQEFASRHGIEELTRLFGEPAFDEPGPAGD
jgi:ferredoxin-nitrite reductase